MKRYQILIQQKSEEMGISGLGRALGIPKQSLSNYLLDGTEPRGTNLDKMSQYFGESVASLIMEVGHESSVDNQIVEALGKLGKVKKKAVLAFIKGL